MATNLGDNDKAEVSFSFLSFLSCFFWTTYHLSLLTLCFILLCFLLSCANVFQLVLYFVLNIYQILLGLLINVRFLAFQACLTLLLEPYTMFGMYCLLPLLDVVDSLVTFAQKRDVFICDFIATVKICQASLHSMYEDPATCFSTYEFWSFNNLLDCNHE